jgi:hypothetical protein
LSAFQTYEIFCGVEKSGCLLVQGSEFSWIIFGNPPELQSSYILGVPVQIRKGTYRTEIRNITTSESLLLPVLLLCFHSKLRLPCFRRKMSCFIVLVSSNRPFQAHFKIIFYPCLSVQTHRYCVIESYGISDFSFFCKNLCYKNIKPTISKRAKFFLAVRCRRQRNTGTNRLT